MNLFPFEVRQMAFSELSFPKCISSGTAKPKNFTLLVLLSVGFFAKINIGGILSRFFSLKISSKIRLPCFESIFSPGTLLSPKYLNFPVSTSNLSGQLISSLEVYKTI